MNTIERGVDRQPELAIDADSGAVAMSSAPEVEVQADKLHTFSRLPNVGVPDTAARIWALADIEGLNKILAPKDKELPLSLMALNMHTNLHYHAALREHAPDVEEEVRTVGVREVRQRSGLLHEHRMQTDFEQRDKDTQARLASDLDGRMAKADLRARGWRDRPELENLMKDLERLAAKSMEKAAALWEKHLPAGADRPPFFDTGDRDATSVGAPARGSSPKLVTEPGERDESVTKDPGERDNSDSQAYLALQKRYLIEGSKYYFRHGANDLAFEDKGKRLATEHDDPEVAKSMVDLAVAKNWTSIKIKGSDEFMRQAWLAASLRGLEVQGYRPSKLDMAKLDELRDRMEIPPRNEIENARPREKPIDQLESKKEVNKSEKDPGNAGVSPVRELSKQQRQAVDTLRELLRARGDSEAAVEMAASLASERFRSKRVYVGKLIETGNAPYENNPDNDDSFYLKLQTTKGERTVWGVDLPRALEEGKAERGDDIVLVYQGKKLVTVKTKELDKMGKPTGKFIDVQAERNSWKADKLDMMRDETRLSMQRVADISEKAERQQPVINVYDYAALRRQERESPPAPEQGRGRQKEPAVPR
jgi:hypothetical protein